MGQLVRWEWQKDILDILESYRSPKELINLHVMKYLDSSCELLISTDDTGIKLNPNNSEQNNLYKFQESLTACHITNDNQVVYASEMGHTVSFYTFNELNPYNIHDIQYPLIITEGRGSLVLVGTKEGIIYELGPKHKLQLISIGEPLISLFYQKEDDSIIAAGKSGKIIRYSFKYDNWETIWHNTGYRTQIKLLPTGVPNSFISLCLDEKIGMGRHLPVISILKEGDKEDILCNGFDFQDIFISSDFKNNLHVG